MHSISIARDFTRYPSGRFTRHSKTSGEEFRVRFLEGPISKGDAVEVVLDGTIGFGSSFLEEAFGGLVRSLNVSPEVVLRLLDLKSVDSSLVTEIQDYIREASPGKATIR